MQIPIIFYCKRKGLHVSSMQTTINTQPAQIQSESFRLYLANNLIYWPCQRLFLINLACVFIIKYSSKKIYLYCNWLYIFLSIAFI